MLKGVIRPPWFMRKRNEPRVCNIQCCKCGYSRIAELKNHNLTVIMTGEENSAGEILRVSRLPEVCPECGAKLKKRKLPVFLRY